MWNVNRTKIAKTPVPAMEHNAKVGLGSLSPSFPPVQVAPADVEDKRKVRLGFLSPVLTDRPLYGTG